MLQMKTSKNATIFFVFVIQSVFVYKIEVKEIQSMQKVYKPFYAPHFFVNKKSRLTMALQRLKPVASQKIFNQHFLFSFELNFKKMNIPVTAAEFQKRFSIGYIFITSLDK